MEFTLGKLDVSRSDGFQRLGIKLPTLGRQLLELFSCDQIVERLDVVFLKKSSEMHVATHSEIPAVLFFNRAHMGVVALIAQLSILISASVAFHSFCVFCHGLFTSFGLLLTNDTNTIGFVNS